MWQDNKVGEKGGGKKGGLVEWQNKKMGRKEEWWLARCSMTAVRWQGGDVEGDVA